MELWIRNQDKENLVKVNEVYVEERLIECKDTILGVYKTKERALEVLDEIQCHLVNINDSGDKYFYVYEMPKE